MSRGQETVAGLSAPVSPPRRSVTGWRRVRLVLLIGWLLLATSAVAVGERTSSFQELESKVASGEVREVTVVGDWLSPESHGFTTVEVHWRDGLVRHVVTVVSAQPRRAAPDRGERGDSTYIVTGSVADRLRASQPGLRVESAGGHPSGSSYLGLQEPAWIGWAAFVLAMGTLCLLIGGPEPWRATRWAWFWLLSVAFPLGMIAFLLLSGPTPLPPPRRSNRRLTGGWAFLLTLVLSNMFKPSGT